MWPTPVIIVLDQKWNIEKLGKILLSKPCGMLCKGLTITIDKLLYTS